MAATQKEGRRSARKSGAKPANAGAKGVAAEIKYVVPKPGILGRYMEFGTTTGHLVRGKVESSAPKMLYFYSVLRGASNAGLLSDSETQHVSIRVPRALLQAAKEETGISSNTDLGILALSAVAQPDPVTAYMKRTRGTLGKEFELEY